jgi:hypothetical protein
MSFDTTMDKITGFLLIHKISKPIFSSIFTQTDDSAMKTQI